MKDLPAIETVPLREPVPVFAATVTVAVPDPDVPPLTAIHGTEDDVDHSQSPLIHTSTGTLCGCAPTDTPMLESVALQVLAACVTSRVRPPSIRFPKRENPVEFGATAY